MDRFVVDDDMGGGDTGAPKPTGGIEMNIQDVDSDFSEDDVEAVTDEDDEPKILEEESHIGRSNKIFRNPMHPPSANPPECIDLTEDDDVIPVEEDEDGNDNETVEMDADDDDDDDLPELMEVPPLSKKELAEERRKSGNEHFKAGNFNQALASYTAAIDLVPTEVSYYGNRSACYMMMKKFQEALADTQSALRLDPTYEKGYLRLVRAHLALGDVTNCEAAILQYESLDETTTDITPEKQKLQQLKSFLADAGASTIRKDFRKVLFLCDRILEIAVGDLNTKVRKGFTLLRLGRHIEAGEVAAEVMTSDMQNVDACSIRALCHYQMDNMDKCLQFFKGALQRNPDAEQPKRLYKLVNQVKKQRETATELFKQGKYVESKSIYLDCLKQVTSEEDVKNTNLESKFSFNLSLIFFKLRMYDESLQYVTKAVDINPSYYKAVVHRAAIFNAKEMYEEAARDFEAALKLDPTKRDVLKHEIQSAKMAAKRAKRKDYYKILDIPKSATEDDIRKAYKKRALLHHPDRHAGATEEVQKEQEKHFKDVGEAYEVLSDPKKKFRYDQGHDLADSPTGGSGMYDAYDPNQLFNMFFSPNNMNMGGAGPGARTAHNTRYYHSTGRNGPGCSFNFGGR